jgi:2-dehydropantoate 2-reductase
VNILCYGAGPIGSLYAARLQEAGFDVSILARGRHLSTLREQGIVLENGATGQRSITPVRVVEALAPSDSYDLVLVMMARHHLPPILLHLAANIRTPNVLFMCNNAAGPATMVGALGSDRVLLGFPGAAGYRKGHLIRYVIVPRSEQPTTVGELTGVSTSRLRELANAFEAAGFPAAVCPNMDAWLKTHAAEIAPTAGALYMVGGRTSQLAASRRALDLMIRAIRENYTTLRARGIPITPRNHSVFRWLPASLLRGIIRRQLRSDLAELKVGHARSAIVEMKLLADALRGHAEGTGSTPAMDELYKHIVEADQLSFATVP